MLRASTFLFWVLLLCGATSALAQTPHRMKPRKALAKTSAAQPQAAPQVQQTPPPPVTPEHGPSSPPDVNFQRGQLTIVARNSTMSDVLNAVKQKTGASVDMPAGSSERVVGQFGPGAPRDVMAQLLNGSHYDYVLLGSPADPGALNKIMLMAKASGPQPAPSPQQPNQPQMGNENLQAVPDVESENPDENAGEVQPNMQEPAQEDSPDQADQQQNGPVVKTPEQLLRELQQQQQQQQQNQGGPPGAPGQPPQ